MFIACYCDLLDVEINCDGCGVTLPGCRYRCLVCHDMDLCATCYSGNKAFNISVECGVSFKSSHVVPIFHLT